MFNRKKKKLLETVERRRWNSRRSLTREKRNNGRLKFPKTKHLKFRSYYFDEAEWVNFVVRENGLRCGGNSRGVMQCAPCRIRCFAAGGEGGGTRAETCRAPFGTPAAAFRFNCQRTGCRPPPAGPTGRFAKPVRFSARILRRPRGDSRKRGEFRTRA